MQIFRFYVSFMVYSYMYPPESATQTNFVNKFIARTGNVISTVLMAVCYMRILVKIRKSRQAVARSTSSTQEAKRRAKEARLAIQFLIIALVFFLVWAMFNICPLLIGKSSLEAYVTVALLVIVNSTVNPVIYLGKHADGERSVA